MTPIAWFLFAIFPIMAAMFSFVMGIRELWTARTPFPLPLLVATFAVLLTIPIWVDHGYVFALGYLTGWATLTLIAHFLGKGWRKRGEA